MIVKNRLGFVGGMVGGFGVLYCVRKIIEKVHRKSVERRGEESGDDRKYSGKYWREFVHSQLVPNEPRRKSFPLKPLRVMFKNFAYPKLERLISSIMKSEGYENRFSVVSGELESVYFQDVVFTSKLSYVFGLSCKKYAFKVFVEKRHEFCEVKEIEYEKYRKMGYYNGLDLIVLINEDLKKKKRENYIFTPEGGRIRFNTMEEVFEFLISRMLVVWFSFNRKGEKHLEIKSEKKRNRKFSKELKFASTHSLTLIEFAQKSNLLITTPGNLSFRINKEYFLVSPSGVDKTLIKVSDLVLGKIDLKKRSLDYFSTLTKPSIDSCFQAILYSKLPKIVCFLHFHFSKYLFVFPCDKTSFAFPCGCQEEATEIFDLLKGNSIVQKQISFCIEMVNHGYLIGWTKEHFFKEFLKWKNILTRISGMIQGEVLKKGNKAFPIFINWSIVGAVLDQSLENLEEGNPQLNLLSLRKSDIIETVGKEKRLLTFFIEKNLSTEQKAMVEEEITAREKSLTKTSEIKEIVYI